MYLKSIEVQGFKSFANKMTFEFHNGITGIVGPNGSGKSNIGDAVRWVLGEQSAKQLRGGKMEDVIFAGTELRKPVSYASVAITIDNSDHALAIDFDQVTITRKVFRSGESEYLINGSACRLRDINELFYDTGIGKEGYSIIGQGQIDKILSGKPDERRELFDEAAGIVKFKRRKVAAQKKLDDESQNLVRVNDILTELEKQVGPLERQSQKAKEYLQLKEKLKENEVNSFLLESDEIKLQLDEGNNKLNIATKQLDDAKESSEGFRSEYEQSEARLTELQHSIEENTQKLNDSTLEKNSFANRIELLGEQINSVKNSDEQLENRLKQLNESIEEREEEKKKIISTRFEMIDKINDYKASMDETDNAVKTLEADISDMKQAVDDATTNIFDILNQKSKIKVDMQKSQSMYEQINIRKAELTRILINCKSDEVQFKNSLNQMRGELDSINSQIDSLNGEIQNGENEISIIRDKLSQINNDMTQLNRAIISETSRKESLRNIAERYDGYGNSIRKVMELKDKKSGILGVVADIIKTDKKYETAIETALGGSIQNIVTDTEDTAKALIAYLKQNKFGRATFLPLSAINGRDIRNDENITKEKGAIGFANTLVVVSPDYDNLSRYLLGRILVVDNIDNALAIARKYRHSLRIVTLEGDQLNPGGSMSGGAFKNSSNLLGRRRELEELEKSITLNEEKLKRLTENMNLLREKQTITREENEKKKITLQEKKIAQNTSKLNLEQAQSKHNELSQALLNSKREQENIEVQLEQLDADIKKAEHLSAEAENKHSELTGFIDETNSRIEIKTTELSAKQLEAENMHIEYSGLSQKGEFAEENAKRIIREISRLNDELEEIKGRLSSSGSDIDAKNKEIDDITAKISDIEVLIKKYELVISQAKEERQLLSEKQKSVYTKRDEINSEITTLEKECMRISAQIEKIEENRDSKIDYMWNEYELTLLRASELRNEDMNDLNELRKNISMIKSEIKKLGDINVNAIEDYKEISERYIFLKTQHDDLINARDILTGIINDLDTGMRHQFTEKFQEIKVEFDKVFKELFGGGKGTLELEEDADILEAGVRIISQPPGKKLQNMMQLSGGEKALTAISLLFAIQNLKPSPFCLLDEIEAALDDSNVGRYANYLHKLTKNTQFIVITHRRGTMAAADRLYGITMQEKGVSTLVSVDLIADQLDEPAQKNT